MKKPGYRAEPLYILNSSEEIKLVLNCLHFVLPEFLLQNLQQNEIRNSPNSSTTPSTTASLMQRNQNHTLDHLPAMSNSNNHHVTNSMSHRFHPYSRPDGTNSQANVTSKVDSSRDPRLKMRGSNGIGNNNGNNAGFVLASSHNSNGTHNTELPARNVINSSRDPRTRR